MITNEINIKYVYSKLINILVSFLRGTRKINNRINKRLQSDQWAKFAHLPWNQIERGVFGTCN